MNNFKIPPLKTFPSKHFKCFCGKIYSTSASLLTHNKQKHQPKPNSNQHIYYNNLQDKYTYCSIPSDQNSMSTTQSKDGEYCFKTFKTSLNSQKTDSENDKTKTYWKDYSQIFIYLKQLDYQQQISPKLWQQITSFKKLEEFLDSNQWKKKKFFKGVSLGSGLSQFFKSISLSTESWSFQQVLILFMLLLQYVIDENDCQLMISEVPVEVLIEYMNPFVNYHIDDFAQHLGIADLWIMNKINIRNFFICFYKWLKWKDYTNFCITLID